MFSKHPFEIPPGRRLSREEVADALRISIMAELDAINLYLQIARSVEDEKVRRVFEDIAREEKTHVGEFLAVLKQLDVEQVEELKRGEEEVAEITGVKPQGNVEKNNRGEVRVEEVVAREVKRLVDSARVLIKRLPVVRLGRGVESVPGERVVGEKVERAVIALCEVGYRFRVTQRALDYAAKTGQLVEMPDAVKGSLTIALEEDRLVLETLIKEAGVKQPLGSWDEPGVSVLDVARAIGELAKRGYRRPYLLIVNPARYTKLLAVSEKTGVTDLERVKAMVDEVLSLAQIPEDKALVVSSSPEIVDVVYGGDAEVDYLGPEDGFHAFKLWSTIATRVKNPEGVVLLEAGVK